MRTFVALFAMVSLAGCTAGGVDDVSSAGASVTSVTTIDVSIAAFGKQSTPAGTGLGYSPDFVTVAVGSGVRFVNVDNTFHTATSIPGATTFPAQSPFTFAAASQASSTVDLSGNWGAGTLQPGQASQVFVADQPGQYLFGCFFHYSGGMRGVIVAK